MQMAMREENVFNCLVSCSFSRQIYILNLPILTELEKTCFFDKYRRDKTQDSRQQVSQNLTNFSF